MAMTPILLVDLSTILPASSSFLATSAARRLLTVIVGE